MVCDLVVVMPSGCHRRQPTDEVILEVKVVLVQAVKVEERRSLV